MSTFGPTDEESHASIEWAEAHGGRRLAAGTVVFDVPGVGLWRLLLHCYYGNYVVRLHDEESGRSFRLMADPSCADFRRLCEMLGVAIKAHDPVALYA